MFSETFATALVTALGAYLGLGAVVGTAFVLVAVRRIDPAAADGTLGFRLLILPGCIALWPLIALRWRAGQPATERNAHRSAARPAGDAP